jgi:hypothetical protein
MAVGRSGVEDGQGAVGLAICATGVPAAEMACKVDPSTSVLEGSEVQENWATDFCGMAGGGRSNKAGEAEDILGAIAGNGGGIGSIASAWGGWQQRLAKLLPPPLPALQASLASKALARMLLSLLPLLLVGVLTG